MIRMLIPIEKITAIANTATTAATITAGFNVLIFTKISTLPVGVVVLAVIAVLVMVVIFSLGISVGIMKKKEF